MIGCLMTLNHNRDKSNMYDEVHKKSLLANHADAFATSGAEGIDQMVGFHELMAKGKGKSEASSAVVLLLVVLGITDGEKPESASSSSGSGTKTFCCWTCNKEVCIGDVIGSGGSRYVG